MVYFVTLGMGLSQDGGTAKLEDATPASWTKGMGTLMSPFARRVDLSNVRCFGNTVSSFFTLNPTRSCSITFSKSSGLTGDEDFWKTEVEARSSVNNKADIPIYTKSKFTDQAMKDSPPGSDCRTTKPSGALVRD
ncbi:MAG: hypothetical protein ACI82Z_000480 [Cellvibrionaceae bacterium]